MEDRIQRRSVAGIAWEDGKVFVARRMPGGSIGGCWEFPGGKVESGEDDRVALEREYLEEFGMTARVEEELTAAHFLHNGHSRLLTAYRVRFLKAELSLREHTEYRWVSLTEVEGMDLADSDRSLLEGLKGRLGVCRNRS